MTDKLTMDTKQLYNDIKNKSIDDIIKDTKDPENILNSIICIMTEANGSFDLSKDIIKKFYELYSKFNPSKYYPKDLLEMFYYVFAYQLGLSPISIDNMEKSDIQNIVDNLHNTICILNTNIHKQNNAIKNLLFSKLENDNLRKQLYSLIKSKKNDMCIIEKLENIIKVKDEEKLKLLKVKDEEKLKLLKVKDEELEICKITNSKNIKKIKDNRKTLYDSNIVFKIKNKELEDDILKLNSRISNMELEYKQLSNDFHSVKINNNIKKRKLKSLNKKFLNKDNTSNSKVINDQQCIINDNNIKIDILEGRLISNDIVISKLKKTIEENESPYIGHYWGDVGVFHDPCLNYI